MTPKYGIRGFGAMDLPDHVEPNFGVDYLKAEPLSQKGSDDSEGMLDEEDKLGSAESLEKAELE